MPTIIHKRGVLAVVASEDPLLTICSLLILQASKGNSNYSSKVRFKSFIGVISGRVENYKTLNLINFYID